MGDKMSNTLAKQLKDLRVMKGITQRQLALETGISYASIVDYEMAAESLIQRQWQLWRGTLKSVENFCGEK